MIPEQLKPNLELLREEYVLVQAWKKTAPTSATTIGSRTLSPLTAQP